MIRRRLFERHGEVADLRRDIGVGDRRNRDLRLTVEITMELQGRFRRWHRRQGSPACKWYLPMDYLLFLFGDGVMLRRYAFVRKTALCG